MIVPGARVDVQADFGGRWTAGPMAPLEASVDVDIEIDGDVIILECVEAQRAGIWIRLKSCGHCGWTVYDGSRNHSSH